MYDNIEIFYDDAEIHITELTARKVIRLLKKRIAAGEKSVQNYVFLADAYMTDKKYHKALKCALKAKAIDNDYYYADVILTVIYAEEGKFLKAEKRLSDLLEKAPDDYYLSYLAAIILYSAEGDEKYCLKYAQKCLELDFKTPDFILIKALCYLLAADFVNSLKYGIRAALKAFNKLCISNQAMVFFSSLNGILFTKLNLDFSFFTIITSFWGLLFGFVSKAEYYYLLSTRLENSEKALKFINQAIEAEPRLLYFIQKADICGMLGNYEEVIDICNDILEKDNSYTVCYKYLSVAYMFLEDYKASLKFVNMELLNDADNESAYLRKASVLRKLNRSDEAVAIFEKLEKINPECPNLYYFYAQAYADLEDYNKALLCINKELMKEKDAANYRDKMFFLYRLERYEEALECGKKGLEYEKQGLIYYWLACCYEKLDKYDDALDCINKSILLGEYDMWTFWQKANILGGLHRDTEAEFAYKKAIELGYKDDE